MPRRIGRPGLMGTVARTAVVAGTATAVSGSMQRHQAEKYEQQQAQQAQAQPQQAPPPQAQAPAPAAAAPAASGGGISDESLEQLQKLSALHSAGALTDEEFAAAKAKILGL